MPLDLADLDAKTRDLAVHLPAYDVTVQITYRLDRWNWKAEAALLSAERVPAQALRDFLLDRLVAWDITNHGEPVPLTPDGMALVDLETIQVPIATAILEDLREGKPPRTASPSPSPTGMPRPSPSRGTVPSRGSRRGPSPGGTAGSLPPSG